MKKIIPRRVEDSCIDCALDFEETIERLNKLKAQVPDGVNAKFEFEAEWEGSDIAALFTWETLETADEYISRIRRVIQNRRMVENQELCTLEKLKEKYGV